MDRVSGILRRDRTPFLEPGASRPPSASGGCKAFRHTALRPGQPLRPPAAQVQRWAELLAHALNHRPRSCLEGRIACSVFQDARPARQAYTRRRRREIFETINELTRTLVQARAVHTQRQAETARRLAVETWLQSNGVLTITQNTRVLPVCLTQIAHY